MSVANQMSSAGRQEATSDSLLQRAREGHAEAWSCMVRLYAPLVLWWCRRRGLSGARAQDAEDVIQEVFKTVAARISSFANDGQPGAFRRWLFSVTDRKLLEYWRKERKAPDACALEHFDQVPAPIDDDSDAPSARIILVRRALEMIRDKFEPRTWNAAWQVLVEDRDTRDVARELSMNVGAVYTAKSRVLGRLREEFAELLD